MVLTDLPAKAISSGSCSKDNEPLSRLVWEIASISVYLEDIRQFLARELGVTGPQWMILMALASRDTEPGVPVNAVSKMMHVDPSFITTQSKLLEKRGLLSREPCVRDARVVEMSLTDQAHQQFARLAEQWEALEQFVFGQLTNQQAIEFVNELAALKKRLEMARLKVVLDAVDHNPTFSANARLPKSRKRPGADSAGPE